MNITVKKEGETMKHGGPSYSVMGSGGTGVEWALPNHSFEIIVDLMAVSSSLLQGAGSTKTKTLLSQQMPSGEENPEKEPVPAPHIHELPWLWAHQLYHFFQNPSVSAPCPSSRFSSVPFDANLHSASSWNTGLPPNFLTSRGYTIDIPQELSFG